MQFQIQRSNRKTIGLSIGRDGALIVKAPFFVSRREIDAAVLEKEDWIEKKQREVLKSREKYPLSVFAEGESVFYLGKRYRIGDKADIDRIRLVGDEMHLPSGIKNREQEIKKWYKEAAETLLGERIAHFQRITGLKAVSVKITDAKHQWGSCSAKGNINFSWRLLMCPPPVIDYVVLHEVIHLLHCNHSKDFYDKMQVYMPDYRERKNWLSQNRHIIETVR